MVYGIQGEQFAPNLQCNKCINSLKLGATRSHLDAFKKHRAARIDHYVIEVNKCIIRLEKVSVFLGLG